MHACLRPLLSNGPSQQSTVETLVKQPLLSNKQQPIQQWKHFLWGPAQRLQYITRVFSEPELVSEYSTAERKPVELVKELVFDSGAAAVSE
jgi:hypothetical protein